MPQSVTQRNNRDKSHCVWNNDTASTDTGQIQVDLPGSEAALPWPADNKATMTFARAALTLATAFNLQPLEISVQGGFKDLVRLAHLGMWSATCEVLKHWRPMLCSRATRRRWPSCHCADVIGRKTVLIPTLL